MAKQTANNGGSQSAGSKGVTFSRQAAQRIAKAVRTVEGGNRNQPGITFDRPMPIPTRTFRMGTFTGSWAISTNRSILPFQVTSATSTFSVSNLFFNVPELSADTNSPTICAAAQAGGTYFLLNVVHADVDVLSSVILQPTRLEFGRKKIASINSTIVTSGISITSCPAAAATSEQLNWFFG